MAAPVFLNIDRVLRAHRSLIEAHFSAMNEWELEADEDGLIEKTLLVACGSADKSEIAEFFRSRAHPSPPDPG